MPVKGGVDGELTGTVYPFVVGLKEGPNRLHLCGKGTTHRIIPMVGPTTGVWLEVSEPSGELEPNIVLIPLDNVAFIAKPMFLIEKPPG